MSFFNTISNMLLRKIAKKESLQGEKSEIENPQAGDESGVENLTKVF